MLAHVPASPRRFVDVVAEVRDQIQVFASHVTIGRKITLFIMLARSDGEPHALNGCSDCRRSARAPDRAYRAAGMKAVPIPAARLEPRHIDVHRMGKFGC